MALTKTEVSKLYVAIFNRASEGEGNTYWQTAKPDMVTTATTMLETQAAKDYFGTSLDTDRAFIEHIYKNTLNKTATDDPDGITFWVNQLATKSRGEVIVELINAIDSYAPDGANYDANDAKTVAAYNQFTNRVKVSDHMADTVEKAPADYATSTAFTTSGDTGLVVTDDAATVTAAEAKIDSLSNPGQFFELTTAQDELVGTDGNDTFTGVISSLSSEKTLNTDDTIDGGAGEDTINLDMKGNLSALTGSIKNVENINLTNSTTIARSFDAKNISDVKVYTLDSEKAINLSNLVASDIEVSTKNFQNDFTIAFDSETDLSGLSDKMALTFDGVGAAEVLNSDGTVETAENDVKVTMADIEEVTLKSQNSASFVDLSGVDATKYIVTGDQDLTVSKVKDGLTSIDASAMSGKLSIDTTDIITAGSLKDITGGNSDDTFTVDAADILANATIVGGEGNDTLKLSDSAGSTIQPNMSGVENLEITGVKSGGVLTISSKDITDLTSITLDANSTDNGIVELVTQGSADIAVKTVGAINSGQDLKLDTSGTVTLNVTGQDAEDGAEESAAGDIEVVNSTSLNVNVDKYMNFTGSIISGQATSLLIDSKGDITSGASSDFSSLESLTITAGGAVDLSNTATLDKVANVTLSGAETTSAVTLGSVGNSATDYDVTITSTGLKAGLTTGTIDSKQNVTANLDGTTGDISLDAITSVDDSVTINAKNLTGTLATGEITAKSVTIDTTDALNTVTIGTDTNDTPDITVTDSLTYTAGLKNANSASSHGLEIATDNDATATTFTLNGGIGDDAFAIQANNSAAATLTIKGDLGIGADQVVVTGSKADGSSSASAAITIDATGLEGSENTALIGSDYDDTIKGSAGVDYIGGMAGKDTLTGGDGADIFIFRTGDSGSTDTTSETTADIITDFKSGDDQILFNYTYSAGSTPSGTATTTTNYDEATSAVADFSAAQTAANSALNDTVKVAFQYDTTNGYLFFDKDGNGTADEVVVLTGIDASEIANTDIIIA